MWMVIQFFYLFRVLHGQTSTRAKKFLKKLELIMVECAVAAKDAASVRWSNAKAGGAKQRRKKLRAVKKGLIDTEKEKEVKESYVPGGF